MSSKTKKKTSNKMSVPETTQDLNDMSIWRGIAHATNPDAKPEELEEIAVLFQKCANQISRHYEPFSKIVGRNDDQCATLTLVLGVDRRVTPSELSVKSGYAAKFGDTVKARATDPKVMELPFEAMEPEQPDNEPGEAQGELASEPS